MMNEVIKAIHERRSIRKYRADMPDKGLIDQVVEAGLWAASGHGWQNSKLIVVKDKQLRDRLSDLNRQVMGRPEGTDPYYGAPMMIVVLDKRDTPSTTQDGSVVIANMMLAAHSIGLASCWINRAREVFELEEGREILRKIGLDSDEWIGVGNLALGYAACDSPAAPPRKEGRVITIE